MIEIHVPTRAESTISSTQVTPIPPSLEAKKKIFLAISSFFSKGAQLLSFLKSRTFRKYFHETSSMLGSGFRLSSRHFWRNFYNFGLDAEFQEFRLRYLAPIYLKSATELGTDIRDIQIYRSTDTQIRYSFK